MKPRGIKKCKLSFLHHHNVLEPLLAECLEAHKNSSKLSSRVLAMSQGLSV